MKSAVPNRTVILSGVAVDTAKETPPVGVYDAVRADVRAQSTVQPVDDIRLERFELGYRGILVSQNVRYLFVMSSRGFLVRRVTDDNVAMHYQQYLADQEAALTAQWNAENADREQEKTNIEFDDGNMSLGPTAVRESRSVAMNREHGPTRDDTVERFPPRVRLKIDTSKKLEGVAAGGVVLNDEGKVLLIQPTGGYGGYEWTFPKGYLTEFEKRFDYPRSHEDAARREVEEETGVLASVERVLTKMEHDDGGTCLYFVMKYQRLGKKPTDGEVSAVRWVSMLDALSLLNDRKDVDLLSTINAAEPRFILKSDRIDKPGSRGGKGYYDEHGQWQYGARPVARPKKTFAVSAVKVGERRVFVHKNGFGVTFLRKESLHPAPDTERGTHPAPYQYDGSRKFTSGEIHYMFGLLYNTKSKNVDAFIKKEVQPLWDDEGGTLPFTVEAAKLYLNDVFAYMETAGLITKGGRDELLGRKPLDWAGFAKKIPNIAKNPNNQKFVRDFARNILSQYGCTSKDTKDSRKHKDTIAVNYELGRSQPGAAAYHAYDGRVGISSYVFEALVSWANGRDTDSPKTRHNEAHAFGALLHEELHGASNKLSMAYQGLGQLVEEVTTEVSARFIMRDKFGHLRMDGAARLDAMPAFQCSGVGPYGEWIDLVHLSIAKVLEASSLESQNDAALHARLTKAAKILEAASLKMKADDVPLATDSKELVENFFARLELTGKQKSDLRGVIEEAVRKSAYAAPKIKAG